jgi:hypothetical protein
MQAHAQWTAMVAQQDKAVLRKIHQMAMKKPKRDMRLLYQKRKDYFADGSEIEPKRIEPKLLEVDGDLVLSDLMRICRGTWSIPVSKGYGRRIRFVVMDEGHGKVMGVLSLQSPPIDLACRDERFSWDPKEKVRLLNLTMDAHLVGAVPPYSDLLGGKLVAGLIASDTVKEAFFRKYGDELVAVTTVSAYGRSSIYNRLSYKGRRIAMAIGHTKGYGTVHLDHLYDEMMAFLKLASPDARLSGPGVGPKIRWQNIYRVFLLLGIPQQMMNHGIFREVFLFPLVSALEQGMAGGDFGHDMAIAENDYASFWKERWCLPRSMRTDAWRAFEKERYFENG